MLAPIGHPVRLASRMLEPSLSRWNGWKLLSALMVDHLPETGSRNWMLVLPPGITRKVPDGRMKVCPAGRDTKFVGAGPGVKLAGNAVLPSGSWEPKPPLRFRPSP